MIADLEALLARAKAERDALPGGDMRDDPDAYGRYMWAGGRVVGILEAIQALEVQT